MPGLPGMIWVPGQVLRIQSLLGDMFEEDGFWNHAVNVAGRASPSQKMEVDQRP
jgi:hypothetical protein